MPETNRSDEPDPNAPAGPEPAGPGSSSSGDDAADAADAADADAQTPLRDRWWWSPALSIVVGLVVAGYQWGPLTGPDGIFLNWVVAAIGLGLALTGVVRLVRAYPR